MIFVSAGFSKRAGVLQAELRLAHRHSSIHKTCSAMIDVSPSMHVHEWAHLQARLQVGKHDPRSDVRAVPLHKLAVQRPHPVHLQGTTTRSSTCHATEACEGIREGSLVGQALVRESKDRLHCARDQGHVKHALMYPLFAANVKHAMAASKTTNRTHPCVCKALRSQPAVQAQLGLQA